MEPERFLRIFPIFIRTWVVLIGSATAFFYFSKNVALKRRVWSAFVVIVGVLFVGFIVIMGSPLPFLLLGATAVILTIIINLKSTGFCDACGKQSRGKSSFSPPEVCAKCGAEMKP
jgi:hypothetical protein